MPRLSALHPCAESGQSAQARLPPFTLVRSLFSYQNVLQRRSRVVDGKQGSSLRLDSNPPPIIKVALIDHWTIRGFCERNAGLPCQRKYSPVQLGYSISPKSCAVSSDSQAANKRSLAEILSLDILITRKQSSSDLRNM